MVTGDASGTATIVAGEVGLSGATYPAGTLPTNVKPEDYSVFASVLPEGKFDLVKAFQKSGHPVGMCGDGAIDAPALRQTHIGVAVSTATDVAKSAAGYCPHGGRTQRHRGCHQDRKVIFQRVHNYTLQSTIKKIAQLLFLTIGLLITGQAVLTPLLMVIVMITGDFLSMAFATDRVRPSETPNSRDIGKITEAGAVFGLGFLGFCTATLAVGKYKMHLDIDHLRTLSVILFVYGSQLITYAVRDRQHVWGLPPLYCLQPRICCSSRFSQIAESKCPPYRSPSCFPSSWRRLSSSWSSTPSKFPCLGVYASPKAERLM